MLTRARTWVVAVAALVMSMGAGTVPVSALPSTAQHAECAVGLAKLACAGLSGSAAAAPAWTPPQALSRAGLSAHFPQVATAANGDATVVWEQHSSTGSRVVASWRVDGGAWSRPQRLSRAGGSMPQVAMNGESAAVVWTSAGRVMVSRRSGDAGWTRSVALARSTTGMRHLDVAVNRRGDITVVWSQLTGKDPARSDVVRAVQRRAGGRWGRPVRLSSGPLSHVWSDLLPQVAMGGRGSTTVLWLRAHEERDDCLVMTARRPRRSAAWSAPTSLYSGQGCGGPLLAMNNRGDTAAVWQGSPVQQQDPFVVAAVRPAAGRWHIEEVPSRIAGGRSGPALDAAGNATVAWDQDDGVGGVRAARRPVGGSWESSVVVSSAGSLDLNPEVAMGGDGTTTVVWSRFLEDGGYLDVQGVQRTPAGVWDEAQSLSNGPPDDPWGGVNVAMDAQGHTVVVWNEIDGTTPRVMVATR